MLLKEILTNADVFYIIHILCLYVLYCTEFKLTERNWYYRVGKA